MTRMDYTVYGIIVLFLYAILAFINWSYLPWEWKSSYAITYIVFVLLTMSALNNERTR